jgi:hypothetical protein
MKMTIVWLNGDKETIEISEKTYENISSGKSITEWDEWRFLLKGASGGINMKYARKFYMEED